MADLEAQALNPVVAIATETLPRTERIVLTPKERRDKIIWAAGFFDGEGCIQLRRQNRQRWGYTLFATAPQKTEEPLRVLESLFGGRVRHIGKTNPVYEWRITTRAAALALEEMFPFLVVKRAQAEIALRYQDARRGSGGGNPFTADERERDVSFAAQLLKARHG